MSLVDVVIGNSSSGLIEAPAFRKPSINLGDRQKGRLRADTIIDCGEDSAEIISAITKAISPDFQKLLRNAKSPYGYGNASQLIKDHLKSAQLENILQKKFYDLEPIP